MTAGVLGIYGLIAAVIINGKMFAGDHAAYTGYAHLAAVLMVGMSSLPVGLAIVIVGDAGVRANAGVVQPSVDGRVVQRCVPANAVCCS